MSENLKFLGYNGMVPSLVPAPEPYSDSVLDCSALQNLRGNCGQWSLELPRVLKAVLLIKVYSPGSKMSIPYSNKAKLDIYKPCLLI